MNTKPIIVAILIVVVAGLASFFWYHSSEAHVAQHFYTVKSATVTSTVTSTGTVQASTNVDLSFQKSAQIAAVNVQVGQTVYAGEVLASLNSADVQAQLAQAQAVVAAQTAELGQLEQGASPEQIQVQETAVAAAQSALDQAQKTAVTQINNAYTTSDSAVHSTADEFFTNPRGTNPMLNIPVNNNNLAISLQTARVAIEATLNSWNASLATLSGATSTSVDLTSALSQAETNLSQVSAFMDSISQAVNSLTPSQNLPQATIDGYKAAVSGARTALTASDSALVGAETAYKGAQSGLTLAQNQLTVEQTGGQTDTVNAQKAMVASAQANVQNLQAALNNTVITSPIAGVVTAQNAKVGQTATPGAPVISLISNGTFQVVSYFPETIIGQITVGDSADVTLDSYGSGVIFTAKVITVDPAETVVNGTPSYKVTLQFDSVDARIRSGMSADVSINASTDATSTVPSTGTGAALTGGAATSTGTIAVPFQSVIEQSNVDYVELEQPNGMLLLQPVTLGVVGSDGMVQVLSGIKDGDSIVTFN